MAYILGGLTAEELIKAISRKDMDLISWELLDEPWETEDGRYIIAEAKFTDN